VNVALGVALIELVTLGAAASRRSGLRGWALIGGSVFTGVLGLLLIFLKALVSH
jgi:hypothetical protein